MIRYKKTSIFMDAKETTSVLELKKMVQGITKRDLEDIRLYKDDQVNYSPLDLLPHFNCCNHSP